MNAKVFFDTNVLVYAVTSDDRRSIPAQAMLARGGSISVQVLNEFAHTARRKLKRSWTEIGVALTALRELCSECLPITERTHVCAREIAEQRGYGLDDSLIIASALEAKCSILITEDMHDGQMINDQLTIRNPFR